MKLFNIILAVLATATVAFADSHLYNADTTKTVEIVEKDGIIVADARIVSRKNTTTGIFLTITNIADADDVLLGIKPDPTFAAQMEIHRTTAAGMETIPSLTVPAKRMLPPQKGGYHIMVTGLQQPIQPDSVYPITLQFENAQDITVSAVAKTKPYSRYGKNGSRYRNGKNGWGKNRDDWYENHRDGYGWGRNDRKDWRKDDWES